MHALIFETRLKENFCYLPLGQTNLILCCSGPTNPKKIQNDSYLRNLLYVNMPHQNIVCCIAQCAGEKASDCFARGGWEHGTTLLLDLLPPSPPFLPFFPLPLLPLPPLPSSLCCSPLESRKALEPLASQMCTSYPPPPPPLPSSLCCSPLESRKALEPLASQMCTFLSLSCLAFVAPATNHSSSSASPRQNTRFVVSRGNWSRRLNLFDRYRYVKENYITNQ